MDYKQTYEQWLNSPALSEAEKAEIGRASCRERV